MTQSNKLNLKAGQCERVTKTAVYETLQETS